MVAKAPFFHHRAQNIIELHFKVKLSMFSHLEVKHFIVIKYLYIFITIRLYLY